MQKPINKTFKAKSIPPLHGKDTQRAFYRRQFDLQVFQKGSFIAAIRHPLHSGAKWV